MNFISTGTGRLTRLLSLPVAVSAVSENMVIKANAISLLLRMILVMINRFKNKKFLNRNQGRQAKRGQTIISLRELPEP
jgi:ABC-type uncharacterized transport system YnjBCD permease subunit